MRTHKDFERVAQVFRVRRPPERTLDRRQLGGWTVWEGLLDDMCIELRAINPRFDEAKFRKACDP